MDNFYKFNLSISMFNYISNPTNCRDFISSSLSSNSTYHDYPTSTNNNLFVNRFNRTVSQSSYIHQSKKKIIFHSRIWEISVLLPNSESNFKITFVLIIKIYSSFFCFSFNFFSASQRIILSWIIIALLSNH